MGFHDEHRQYLAARDLLRGSKLAQREQVFLGSKYVSGKPTADLAIRFNVRVKKPRARLTSTELIPRRIGDFRTDVTSFQFRRQTRSEPPYSIIRPLLGGAQIQAGGSQDPMNWGTMGCVFEFNGIGYGITNYHVLNARGTLVDKAGAGQKLRSPEPQHVIQPARKYFGERIGDLADAADETLDYALFRMIADGDQRQHLNGIDGVLAGYLRPAGLGLLTLIKSGAATGVTHGVYDGRSLTNPYTVLIRRRENSPATRLSAPGDSGSAWVEDPGTPDADDKQSISRRLFALHVGGESSGRLAIATLFSSIWPSMVNKLNRNL